MCAVFPFMMNGRNVDRVLPEISVLVLLLNGDPDMAATTNLEFEDL